MEIEDIKKILRENQKKTEVQKNTNVEKSSFAGDLTRATAQGLTFGFGDEIEALFKSATSGDITYEEAVKQARGKLDRFRKENPVIAYGSEIAGSIPTMLGGGAVLRGIQGAKKLADASKVGQAVKSGAVSGGIYGAGTGEGAEGKALGVATGGALGGVLGGATAKIFPKTTDLAKKLMKKDVRVTTGQAFGGEGNVLGNVLQNFEQSTSSLVGVGSPIQTARITALADFNRAVMKEALEPITGKISIKKFNELVPRNLKGNELFKAVDDIVSQAYTKELGKVSLNAGGVESLRQTIRAGIFANPSGTTANKTSLFQTIDDLIKGKLEANGTISGESFKALERDLRNLSMSYKRSTGGDIFLARLVDEARRNAGSVLKSFNPESNLANINKTQVGMSAIQKAVNKASGTEGIFSTNQFLNALKQNDASIGKKITARGEGFLRETGELAQSVMGNYIPDSGTASRLITGNISVDPMKALAYAPATIVSELAYGPTRGVVRGLLQTPRAGLSVSRPTTSGLLAENINQGILGRGQ
tara:strand:- start:567 stop:2165 length:1599 start_codon:yes stop_codon:yes gene_type:complete